MNSTELVDWAVATRPLAGQAESGDSFIVRSVGPGVLVGVVDGLGHGPEAAVAARAAVSVLDRYSPEPLPDLMKRCHEALHGTRGAVMSLAYLDGTTDSLTWLGVGNVQGVILNGGSSARRTRTTLVAAGGILGSVLPRLQSRAYPVARGTTLIFASDGIKSAFADELSTDVSPEQLADQILARYGIDTDDALVLVVRYGSTSPGFGQ